MVKLDIVREIYAYDPTYRSVYDEVVKDIPKFTPIFLFKGLIYQKEKIKLFHWFKETEKTIINGNGKNRGDNNVSKGTIETSLIDAFTFEGEHGVFGEISSPKATKRIVS